MVVYSSKVNILGNEQLATWQSISTLLNKSFFVLTRHRFPKHTTPWSKEQWAWPQQARKHQQKALLRQCPGCQDWNPDQHYVIKTAQGRNKWVPKLQSTNQSTEGPNKRQDSPICSGGQIHHTRYGSAQPQSHHLQSEGKRANASFSYNNLGSSPIPKERKSHPNLMCQLCSQNTGELTAEETKQASQRGNGTVKCHSSTGIRPAVSLTHTALVFSFSFFKDLFNLYVWVFCLHACLVPLDVRKGSGFPATGVIDGCEQLCRCRGLNQILCKNKCS